MLGITRASFMQSIEVESKGPTDISQVSSGMFLASSAILY